MNGRLLIAALGVGLTACAAGPSDALWRESRFTRAERDHAVRHGLELIYSQAENDQEFFVDNIGDFLWCYYSIVATTPDEELRAYALERGRALAERWKRGVWGLPLHAGMGVTWDLASTLYVAEELGVHHDTLRAQLEPAIRRWSVKRWLDFDPRTQPPPTTELKLTGAEACAAVGKPGSGCPEVTREIVDMDIFYDAMITTYFGDRFGVTHGATFDEFIHWLPQLYPYGTREELGDETFYDLIYIVTHVVYTHNDYGVRRLSPLDLPEEFLFLRDNFHVPYGDGDCETYAEFVDTMKSFGLTPETDANMALAIESLMALQNADGSWGDPGLTDPYDIFHTTWTAIEALRDYRFATP
jgi:hypothetical protein